MRIILKVNVNWIRLTRYLIKPCQTVLLLLYQHTTEIITLLLELEIYLSVGYWLNIFCEDSLDQ